MILNNPKVLNNLRDGLPYPYTENDAEDFIRAMLSADKDTTFAFAIALDDKAIGSIGVFRQDALALGAGIVIAVALHEVDHTPHGQTGTEGNNECLKDRNRLIDKFHRVTSLIFECE